MPGLCTRLRHCDKGAAAVEMALVAPVLVLCLLGTADFGLAVHERMRLSGAVRVGAQVAMTDPTATARITQAVQQATASLDAGRLAISVTTFEAGDDRRYVTVRAEETYPLLLTYPGLGSAVRLSADATMRTQGEEE